MRIVLDMNVWVSALISPAGTPVALMRKLEDHILITSEDMLEKVQRVLPYNRIADRNDVTPGMAKEYVENIRASAVLVAANLPDTPIVEADRRMTCFLYAPPTDGRTVSSLVTATCYASLSIKASQ